MSVSLHIESLGKKFGVHWLFKSLDLTIQPEEHIAVLGANGSGKSTLLKLMAGFLYHQKGTIRWRGNGGEWLNDTPEFSYSAPYLDVFEHLTVREMIAFHFKQRTIVKGFTTDDVLTHSHLEKHHAKEVRQLSSGMRQRLKNALALMTATDVTFLDEPCSNLDEENISIYRELVASFCNDRMLIIASNHTPEYEGLVTKQFRISDGKLILHQNSQLWA